MKKHRIYVIYKIKEGVLFMENILNYIFQYGVGTLCVAYLIYFQSTTMKDMNNTLVKMIETLNGINTRLSIIEDKLERKEGN